MMMATNKNVPAIRFKSFEEEWQEKKVGEIFDCDIPTNTLSRANLSNNQGDIKNIHYGDILIKYSSCLNVSENKIPYITGGRVIDFKNHFLQDGDIIFADAAEDEMVGKSIEIFNVSNKYVVAGLHTIATRPLIKFQNYYLGYYLNSNSFHGQLISLMQGTKVLSISKNNLKKTLLKYPKPTEQTEIGKCFKELDDLIQLQEQKLKRVKNLKKAMLEKMFPKVGADIPEIRFSGFTENWERYRLGEVADLLTGNPFESKKFVKRGVLLVRGMNVKRGYLDISEDISEYWHTSKGMESYSLKENDIVIQMDGALIGKSYAKISSKNLPALLVQRVTRVRNSKVHSEFIYQKIQRDFLKHIIGIKTETAVPHLSLNDIKNFEIDLPSKNEQQKIGEYFQNLDQLIGQSQQKIKQLKHLKQALLQKMFI
jgi:type I restriction enzyme S subunit